MYRYAALIHNGSQKNAISSLCEYFSCVKVRSSMMISSCPFELNMEEEKPNYYLGPLKKKIWKTEIDNIIYIGTL